ncbi:hypothetical protein BKA69DRAFT_1038201 [Paraphysoderma sedebokerense]|nr:hypothetical protein BKA69DRAFT_1038199 [Paraphysoderma sedebokerense]KAI9141891.1 hypothetical protein BKA69DRAFT_1038201 [Paraphysoderma sedebokerense]
MAIPIRQNAAPPRKRLLSNPVTAASHSSHSPSSDSYLSESLRSDSAFSSSLQSESARQYNQYASSWNGNPSSLKSIWMLHSETNIPYEQSQQRVPHTYSQSHQRTTTTNSNFNSVFLSMSYDEKSSSHLTSQSPTRKLSSIPEQDARRSFDLTNDDDNDNEEHQILPSSLNELLTPAERRRYSIQSDLMRLAGSGDGNGLMGRSPPVEHDWFSPNPNSSPSRSLFGASNNEPRMQTFNPMNGRLSSSVPQSSFNNLPFNGHLQIVQPFNNAQEQLVSNHSEKLDNPSYLIDDEGAPFYMEPLNESSIEATIDGGIETGNSPNKNDLSGTVTSLLTLSLNERGESPAGVTQKVWI